MKARVRPAVLVGLVGSALFVLVGAADCTHGSSDTGSVDHQNAKVVIQMPFGFRNVAMKCQGTDGVYVTSAGADDSLPSALFVVKDDPNCTG